LLTTAVPNFLQGPSENKRQRIDPQQIEYRFQLLVNRSEEEGGQVEMGAEEWVGRQEINELDHTQRAARLRDLQLTANTVPIPTHPSLSYGSLISNRYFHSARIATKQSTLEPTEAPAHTAIAK